MNKSIQVLDCTLRDGGLALEDRMLNRGKTLFFDPQTISNFLEPIKNSKIDIIELGAIEKGNSNKQSFSIYQSIEEVSKLMPIERNDNQMYVALFRGPDTPIKEIPEWNPNLCEGIRVIIRYSEIEKSLTFCQELKNKGYKVFVQPMVTMRYTHEQLDQLITASNKMKAFALYIVDSYGYMEAKDLLKLYNYFDNGLDKEIQIGFHSHNNLNLAFSNVKSFIEAKSDRSIIVDSTIMGMGQGAGNIQTELLISYLNQNSFSYDFNYVLDACEIIDSFWQENIWGYSVTNLLPAINKTAYKYSASLRDKYKLSYSQIHQLLSNIPSELRHRYTAENVEKLIYQLKS